MLAMIVPCYNEAQRLDLTYWAEMLKIPDTQWIFVNDGSSDHTQDVLENLAKDYGARVLKLDVNMGKANAIRSGLLMFLDPSQFPKVTALGFIDADGAFERNDVAHIIGVHQRMSVAESVDTTWSARVGLSGRNIRRSLTRHYLGRVLATALSLGPAKFPYDTQSGLKLFGRSPEFFATLRQPFGTRWLFEVEILLRWRAEVGRGMRVWEEPLHAWTDVAGSKVSIREYIRIFGEFVKVKRLQNRLSRDHRNLEFVEPLR